jgi:phage-related protein
MKRVPLGVFLALAISVRAEPPQPTQLELRNTISFAADLTIAASSMFNPRYFDGDVYANQINTPAFGRYRSGSSIPSMLVDNTFIAWEHRMVAPFRGDHRSVYLLGSSGANNSFFTRYDFNGENPVDESVPGEGQTAEGFDWVDENTLIYTTYNPSANRTRLSLAHVIAEPFMVTADTRWNANGFIETSATTRIRNVRVGDQYSGHAYYGDAGQNDNPTFFAIDLATGIETVLGNAGTLTGGGSFGLWTVIERGGYLYVQTTDNGIQVYEMTSATTLGPLYTTYTAELLEELTGYTGQYWGFDVSPDGRKFLLGAAGGTLHEVGGVLPLKLRNTIQLATDLGIAGSSMFNPRYFDGDVYVNQINTPSFGRYPAGSNAPSLLVNNTSIPLEHRMVAPFRSDHRSVYLLGSSGASTTFFSRYDFDGENRVDADIPGDNQTAEGFDWVDESTVIYTTYNPSANRRRISLARVTAEPFTVTADTRWNANGFIETSATTRIRNVRAGDQYSSHAYYGDAGQNASPGFFAIDLATGAETALGDAGTLSGAGSFGLWTVVERGGQLYVQTTDNGIWVYALTSATALGPLATTYPADLLEEVTGYTGQYWGFDVAPDGTLLLGGANSLVFELEVRRDEPLLVAISRSENNVVLSWPASITDAVVQASPNLSAPNFADLDPQPAVSTGPELNTATIPIGPASVFYRLRK